MADEKAESILPKVLPLYIDDLLEPNMSLEGLVEKILGELDNSGCYTAYVVLTPDDREKNDAIYSACDDLIHEAAIHYVLERCCEVMVVHVMDEHKHTPKWYIGPFFDN